MVISGVSHFPFCWSSKGMESDEVGLSPLVGFNGPQTDNRSALERELGFGIKSDLL